MVLTNRRQRFTMGVIALLFILLGLFPPWRLADGRFLGLHPAWSPPPAVPDSLPAPVPRREYLPIQIVPQNLYRNPSADHRADETMLRRPYLAYRLMLAVGTVLFLGGILVVILLRDKSVDERHESQKRDEIKRQDEVLSGEDGG